MSRQIKSNLDLNGLQLLNVRVHNDIFSQPPTEYGPGQMWWVTDLLQLLIFDGSSWNPVASTDILNGTTINNILKWDGTAWVETSQLQVDENINININNAAIRVGNTSDTTAGNIRWDGSNFSGYNGFTWVAFYGANLNSGNILGDTLYWDGTVWQPSNTIINDNTSNSKLKIISTLTELNRTDSNNIIIKSGTGSDYTMTRLNNSNILLEVSNGSASVTQQLNINDTSISTVVDTGSVIIEKILDLITFNTNSNTYVQQYIFNIPTNSVWYLELNIVAIRTSVPVSYSQSHCSKYIGHIRREGGNCTVVGGGNNGLYSVYTTHNMVPNINIQLIQDSGTPTRAILTANSGDLSTVKWNCEIKIFKNE